MSNINTKKEIELKRAQKNAINKVVARRPHLIECSECRELFATSGEWNAHDCLSHLTLEQLESSMRAKGLL